MFEMLQAASCDEQKKIHGHESCVKRQYIYVQHKHSKILTILHTVQKTYLLNVGSCMREKKRKVTKSTIVDDHLCLMIISSHYVPN